MLRLHPPLLTSLDEWIGRQKAGTSRPEAIRRLLEHTLASQPSDRLSGKSMAEKAAKLAARAVEEATDKSQPAEEQQSRKRKLIKGPSEFRDIRRDQPKRKQ